jgi:site-specific recombinase XerD
MPEFRSIFAAELIEFIALKQKAVASETYDMYRRILGNFDNHLVECGLTERAIDEPLVTSWIAPLYESVTVKTVSSKVSHLRKFLEYLRFCGCPVYVPEGLPKYTNNYIAYLFSDSEVEAIFRAADNIDVVAGKPTSHYYRFTFPMVLRMLFGCGLRLGETLSMKVGDVNFESGVLLMKNTKNSKQRIVPMDGGLTGMIQQYCTAMGIIGSPGAWLFPTHDPKRHLHQATADKLFKNILMDTKIYVAPKPRSRGQCLHCFRHLFTVKSFAQAERDGRSISDSVPFLSIYLGHFDMDGTERYLKFSGDMFPEYTVMFEEYAANVFSGGLYEKE